MDNDPLKVAAEMQALSVQIAQGCILPADSEFTLSHGAQTIRDLAAQVAKLEAYIHGQH